MTMLRSPLSSFTDLKPTSWAKAYVPAKTLSEPRPANRKLNLMAFLNAAILSIGMASADKASAHEKELTSTALSGSTASVEKSVLASQARVSIKLAEMLLSPFAKEVIGDVGLERLRSFEGLRSGWDGSGSKPLQLSSLLLFNRFLDKTAIRPANPSIFMSSYGELILAWQDENDCVTELKFRQNDIEFYSEATDQQLFVQPREFEQLLGLLDLPERSVQADQLPLGFWGQGLVVRAHEPFVAASDGVSSYDLSFYQHPQGSISFDDLKLSISGPFALN